MRILQISWEYPPVLRGGLGRHVDRLCEQLAATGTEVDVLTAGAGPETVGEEVRDGVRVHRVRWPGSATMPHELDTFLRWVAAMNDALAARGAALLSSGDRFDVVHSHDWLVAGAARTLAAAGSVAWVVTVHATEHGRHAGRVAAHPQSTIHARERAMVADADRVIACSAFMRGHVAEVLDADPAAIAVVPNGIDGRDLGPAAAGSAALRASLAGPGDVLVLLAGRLVHEKGFAVALEAVAPLVRQGGVRFAVAGTGPAESELRTLARELGIDGAGSFLGWVADDVLHGLMRVADLCAIPSLYEPSGIVALEAMASGCACVVSDTGGLRELATGEPPAALRAPPGDAAALSIVLGTAIADAGLRERLAAAGVARVAALDWSHVAAETRAVYTAALRSCSGGSGG